MRTVTRNGKLVLYAEIIRPERGWRITRVTMRGDHVTWKEGVDEAERDRIFAYYMDPDTDIRWEAVRRRKF